MAWTGLIKWHTLWHTLGDIWHECSPAPQSTSAHLARADYAAHFTCHLSILSLHCATPVAPHLGSSSLRFRIFYRSSCALQNAAKMSFVAQIPASVHNWRLSLLAYFQNVPVSATDEANLCPGNCGKWSVAYNWQTCRLPQNAAVVVVASFKCVQAERKKTEKGYCRCPEY